MSLLFGGGSDLADMGRRKPAGGSRCPQEGPSIEGLSPHRELTQKRRLQVSLHRLFCVSSLPGSMGEHVFNKYPVAFGAVLDEDVGDCAD